MQVRSTGFRRLKWLCGLLGALSAGAAQAQMSDGYELWLYGWLSGLDGTVGIGPVEADVDASISDVLDALDVALMAAFRVEQGNWVWTVDADYARLENDYSDAVTLEVEQTLFRATGGWRFEQGVELFIGARAVNLENTLKLDVNGMQASPKAKEDWVEPLVGAGYRSSADRRWQVLLAADVGGFGMGSDLSWSAQAAVRYGFSERFGMAVGYRVLDIDYEDGNGANRFLYDISQHGPLVALGWRF